MCAPDIARDAVMCRFEGFARRLWFRRTSHAFDRWAPTYRENVGPKLRERGYSYAELAQLVWKLLGAPADGIIVELGCGLTEQDMTLRGGPYYSEDWRDRRIAVDYLYELGSDREASTTHVVGAIAARGLGKAAARHVLDELDDAGIAIPRSIRRSNEVVWCHVANYNPPELATK